MVISEAQEIVRRIYAIAGVELACFPANPTGNNIPSNELKIRIAVVSKDAAAAIAYPPDALAFTPGFKGRRGRLAYILEHRVTAVAKGYNIRPALVLGAAIAHEIGHMFLSAGHAPAGLMRTEFNQSDFRRIASGDLRFTDTDAAEIRAYLAGTPTDFTPWAGTLGR